MHPIAALQSEWSLFSRDVEASVVPAARELGVAFVPYSPLGRGFLTGSFANAEKELTSDDFRRQQPRFNGDNAAANADPAGARTRRSPTPAAPRSDRSLSPGCSSRRRCTKG